MQAGELVYLPSKTMLRKIKQGTTTKFCLVEKPTDVLVVESKTDKVIVHYRGEKWVVDKKDVYYG